MSGEAERTRDDPALGNGRALFLGVDASTTAVKAIAFDAAGNAVAEGRAGLELSNPEPDGWEQDAASWWHAFIDAVRACTSKLGDASRQVKALCIAHQRETVVVTDPDGTPLHAALVWMDARCRAQVREVVDLVGDATLHELSGKPACTTPSLYKLRYLFAARPELRDRDVVIADVHAFLVKRLLGEYKTSLASADPLGLVNMKSGSVSQQLLSAVGTERVRMPELVAPGVELGKLPNDIADALNLPRALPVIAGAGDGQAAGLGAGIVGTSEAYLNLGTAIVSGVLSKRYRVDRSFRTLFAAQPGAYFLETDLKGGTFTLNWLTEKVMRLGDGTGSNHDAGNVANTSPAEALAKLEEEAEALPPGAEGLLHLPYLCAVMNPYWNDDASGAFVGLNGEHGLAHLYRAIIEGIAFEQRLHSEGVERALGSRIETFVVMGGGAKSELWCRILADVLGRLIVRAGTQEATALGAALLAAVGIGTYANVEQAAASMVRRGERFEPGEQCAIYRRLYNVYCTLYPSLRETMQQLTALRDDARPTRRSPDA